jgi:hypothetical protein
VQARGFDLPGSARHPPADNRLPGRDWRSTGHRQGLVLVAAASARIADMISTAADLARYDWFPGTVPGVGVRRSMTARLDRGARP